MDHDLVVPGRPVSGEIGTRYRRHGLFWECIQLDLDRLIYPDAHHVSRSKSLNGYRHYNHPGRYQLLHKP